MQPPDQQIESVLAEKRLTLEDEQRHASVACFELTSLIGLDDALEMLRVSRDRIFKRLRTQSGPADCVGKVVTVVPAVGSPVPNQSHHLILKFEPRPRLHGSRGEVGKPFYQGLLGRNFVGLHILGYGIRS